MRLTIDPPSGIPDSYFDIKFHVDLDKKAQQVTTQVFNKTSGKQLDFIGVHSGYIINENVAVFENAKSIEGFVGLFPDDRKNKKFVQPCVDLEVKIKTEELEESLYATFYNESSSLDSGIVPIDVNVINKVIDIENDEPLKLNIVADSVKTVEFVIRSENTSEVSFSIKSKVGMSTIEVPAAILSHDLKSTGLPNKCSLFYIKHEGVSYSRFVSRHYLPVADSDITLNGIARAKPQIPSDPIGRLLSSDFTISDRYLVPVKKEFSAFRVYDSYKMEKIRKISMYIHESQNMETTGSFSGFESGTRTNNITAEMSRKITQDALIRDMRSRHLVSEQRAEMFEVHNNSFMPNKPLISDNKQEQKKGCGCGRKNNE